MSAELVACASATCPIAGACRRKTAADQDRRSDTWHWRRSSFSDRVVCNGYEPQLAGEKVAHV